MKNKSILFLTLSGVLLLAGCNNVPSSSSSDSSLDTSIEDSSSSSSVVDVEVPPYLIGKFFSPSGVITIGEENVTFNDSTLSYTRYDEVDETLYLTNSTGNTYRLYLSDDEKMEVILDIQDNDEFVLVDSFMPDITPFVGTYTTYGDSSPYNIPIVITDEYVADLDTFTVNQPIFTYSSYDNDYYFATTYFSYIDNELKTMIDIWDYEDDYLYYSLYLQVNNGVASLYDTSYESEAYYADVSFVYGTYFVSKTETLTFNYSPLYDEKTWEYSMNDELTIGEELYNIELVYDNGSYLKIYNDTKEALLQSTGYGLKWIENNETHYYPYNTLEHLVGNFKNEEGLEYNFEIDYMNYLDGVLSINGVEKEFDVVVFEDKLGISTSIEGYDENVVFIEFKTNISIEMYADETYSYLVNYNAFSEAYVRDYFNIVYTSDGSIVHFYSVDSNLILTSNNQTSEGYFDYDPREDYPSLVYSDWTINVLDYENKIFSMTQNNGLSTIYLFDESFFANLENKEYTSGRENIVFKYDGDKINLNYKNEDIPFILAPVYDEYSFSYLIVVDFEYQGDYLEFIYQTGGQWTEYALEEGQYVATDSYIPVDIFNKLVGVYQYEGEYGVEGFELTSDGKFYADVLNETGDGLIKHQEKDYQLQMLTLGTGEVNPVITFYHDGYWVNCYFEDYSLLVVETRYVREELFSYSGIYVDENNTNILAIYQNKIMLNGEEVSIIDMNETNDILTIEVSVNDVLTSIVFETDTNGDKKATCNGVEYILSDVDYESFIGNYTDASGNTYVFDYHYGLGGVINGFELTYTSSSAGVPYVYTDFVVVLKNGHITLQFSGIGETYYLEMDGSEVVASVESSIPLPPPPPMAN